MAGEPKRVWYPVVEDVIDANITVLDVGGDKHPYRLLLRPEAIQTVIDRMTKVETKGLACQAAWLMKELVKLHAFDGANYRTAYLVGQDVSQAERETSQNRPFRRCTSFYQSPRDEDC